MGVSFLKPELAKWDALAEAREPPELLVAPFFADERPLRGTGGLVDWRLCGRLSRLLAARRVTGALGETPLLPAGGLGFGKGVLYGPRPPDGFDQPRFPEAAGPLRPIAARLRPRPLPPPPPPRAPR